MADQRPDPDELLTRIKDEEARSARGKLKIFFGASAGVGKTYAMLSTAHQQASLGTDVVIGVVETHGRKETEALIEGIERLPLKEIPYRARILKEFDLDGALKRKPALILMDELAHSNVQGSRHPKRWQDVHELLAAGIDVYSTINVQHLETLNDVVGGITGIRIWETVPDHVFDEADEVVLVDLPPDELLQRLKEGKVYMPHQAERAIQNFFRKGNLIALRELALRRTADRVDSEMLQYRRDQSVVPVWQTRESIAACIGPGKGAERIIRSAARIAAKLDVPWHAIYVETPELRALSESRRQYIYKALKLAQETGAETATLSGGNAVDAVIAYARDHNLSKVIVGRDHARAWRPWYRSVADRIGKLAPDLDVIQVAREEGADRGRESTDKSFIENLEAPWRSFAMSAAYCGIAALVAMLLYPKFELTNIAMLFLLAVVLSAVRYGLGPAVAASFLNVVVFDFFFVPPRFSFAVSNVQYLLTFAVMLVVGLITAKLTSNLTFQARIAGRREQRMSALYEMSRELSAALLPEQILGICHRFAETEFSARTALVLTGKDDRLLPPISIQGSELAVDAGIGQWTFDHEEAAGIGTDTLPGSTMLYVPLKAPMRMRGVLVLEPRDPRLIQIPEQRRLLDTFARLIAIALERVHYVDIAQQTTVQMESERLRNSLLSAISHDLRTPLTALIGLADSMLLTKPPLTQQQAEISTSMRKEAQRMNALVNNLLDMARLQAGAVRLNLQWQPLEEVIGSAIKNTGANLQKQRVSVHLPDDLPLLQFDAVLIERVLVNLLDNAIKYTPLDSLIEISAAPGASDMIEVRVEDNGPGLPAGREEEIFKKFERGQKESATPGVGLGLTICRAIVEAHGGSIRAETRPEGGARFIFSLPRGIPPAIREEYSDAHE